MRGNLQIWNPENLPTCASLGGTTRAPADRVPSGPGVGASAALGGGGQAWLAPMGRPRDDTSGDSGARWGGGQRRQFELPH